MTSAAELVQKARRARAYSQRDLAERSGVPQPSIAKIESGRTVPRVDTLDRLLQACGHTVGARHLTPPVDPDDWTLVQANLRLTPAQRLEKLAAWAAFVAQLRDARRT